MRRELLTAVADTLRDYREGEIPPMTPEHVERWVSQFPAETREMLLAELLHVFRRLYFSRERVERTVRGFLQSLLQGRDAAEVLPYVAFLDLQQRGGSQKHLLRVADRVLREDWGFPLARCGTRRPHVFLYLDDAVSTGNRLRYDLTESPLAVSPAWLASAAPAGCGLVLFSLACHRAGFEYAWRHLEPAAERQNVTVTAFHAELLDNRRVAGSDAEFLWPEQAPGDPLVQRYVAHLGAGVPPWTLFRDPGTPPRERLFRGPEGRRLVEQALLRAGIPLALAAATQRHHRPLGFEVLPSLGFGSLFVTHRNIANNSPLALWWNRHPDRWYPLLPRAVNRP